MTIDKFNETEWTANMKAIYHGDGRIYPISACDFKEQLLGLEGMVQNEPKTISWVRCENVSIELNAQRLPHPCSSGPIRG